uniref:Lysosome-associated membrane glycoprotein 2-like luminal domain-containing protein n=1 Tax=Malurus cyaneus samueli TaxID=2593467 RepID=A0A8C5X0L9_9PASS
MAQPGHGTGHSASHHSAWDFFAAFSSCFAEVALGVKLYPETTSFHQMATSSQPPSLYYSSPHQSTTVHFNSTGSLQTTPMSHRTSEQHQATAAPGQHGAEQAGAGTVSTTAADTTSTDSQATTQTMLSVTDAVENKTTPSVSSTRREETRETIETTAAATNTSLKHETVSTQVTAATNTSAATTSQRAGRSTRTRRQTTATEAPTAMAVSSTTTTHAGTQTAPTSSARTVSPSPAPQPSAVPTGTYTVSDGNTTCIKAVMGLQLMAQDTQQEQVESVTVNPNVTQISGSCGTVQSELNLTFSGGFVNFTFVKVTAAFRGKVCLELEEVRLPLIQPELWQKLFTTKLGNSFKCTSRQTFTLERNFQILFVHVQLQAFDIADNQFGNEEECFLDRSSKAAPIAVCLCILGLFVIVFVTFLISRRKPQRGYQRI